MEAQRSLLLAALFMVTFLLWNAWERDYGVSSNAPVTAQTGLDTLPEPALSLNHATVIPESHPENRLIQVDTDVLSVTIDTLGGKITQTQLLQYPETLQKNSAKVTLLNPKPEEYYVANSSMVASNGADNTALIQFKTDSQSYALKHNDDKVEVRLKAPITGGLAIDKVFTFYRNQYLVAVDFVVNNKQNKPWDGYYYNEITRKPPIQASQRFAASTYTGAALSSPEQHFEKLSFSDMEKANLSRTIVGGWAAMLQHYFLSAWIPSQSHKTHFYTKAKNDLYTIGFASGVFSVPANSSQTIGTKFYSGPTESDRLKQAAPYLKLAVDYGHLWFISEAIFWLMKQFYVLFGNWGWAIIFVTLSIKLLFYKLSESSYRSMARLRELHPRLEAIKEQFGHDKQQLTEATMKLYRDEAVSPFGGCLAIIPQIPVFLALYWVIVESVQLRQAPFIFWIHDLSVKDPFYILPILMGASMFLQQRMSPAPPDPMQAKVMMFMPILFTGLFMNFPSGLVLYWFTNNVLSMLQQWWIIKTFDSKKEVKTKPQKNKNSKPKWLMR